MQSVKCVVIGDGAVGKTYMLLCHCSDVFPEEYFPATFTNYKTDIKYDDTYIQLCLWDTAGQGDYDKFRPLSYPGTVSIYTKMDTFSYVWDTAGHDGYDKIRPMSYLGTVIMYMLATIGEIRH